MKIAHLYTIHDVMDWIHYKELYIITYRKIWCIYYTLLFLWKKFMENNTVFETRYHNFRILQFTRMVLFIRITDKLRIELYTTFCFATNGKKRREPCKHIQVWNCSVKKLCFFTCFVMYLCGMASYANNMGGFFINSLNETKFSKFG